MDMIYQQSDTIHRFLSNSIYMKIEKIINLELFLVAIAVSIGLTYVTTDMKIILRKNL